MFIRLLMVSTIGLTYMTATLADSTALNLTDMIGTQVVALGLGGALNQGQDIGEIDDVIIDQGGNIPLVIISVGGFLGVGKKPIALPLDRITPVTDNAGNTVFVLETTPEELHNLPLYEPGG